jgi:hypothetical protein
MPPIEDGSGNRRSSRAAASGGARRARESTASTRDWSCTRPTGGLFHLFGQFLLEAAEAFAPAGRFIRDVLSKTRGAAVSAG